MKALMGEDLITSVALVYCSESFMISGCLSCNSCRWPALGDAAAGAKSLWISFIPQEEPALAQCNQCSCIGTSTMKATLTSSRHRAAANTNGEIEEYCKFVLFGAQF